jgi:hypothetical protein
MAPAAVVGLATLAPAAAAAPEAQSEVASLTLDLLPPVASLAAGGFGAAIQAGYGWNRSHVRLVAASTLLPEPFRASMRTGEEVRRHRLTAVALIYDHFFVDAFAGLWLGAGVEMWVHDLATFDGVVAESSGPRAREASGAVPMATFGLGYVWRFGEWFFVNPWGAAHLELLDTSDSAYELPALSISASVKVGAYFGL